MKDFIITLIVVVIILIITHAAYIFSVETTTITVTDKERITESSGSGEKMTVDSYYLVYTNVETFKNVDELMFVKVNSSDIQGKLIPNETYQVKVAGWRIPIFSSYRNIIEIVEK